MCKYERFSKLFRPLFKHSIDKVFKLLLSFNSKIHANSDIRPLYRHCYKKELYKNKKHSAKYPMTSVKKKSDINHILQKAFLYHFRYEKAILTDFFSANANGN